MLVSNVYMYSVCVRVLSLGCRVNQKLETTKAPKITGRTQSSYSGMKQRVVSESFQSLCYLIGKINRCFFVFFKFPSQAELKEKCLSLVQRNQELEQKSEERKRWFCLIHVQAGVVAWEGKRAHVHTCTRILLHIV